MSGEWSTMLLHEFADIEMGQSPKSEYYNNSGNGIAFMQGNRTFGMKYHEIDTFTTKITKKALKDSILFSVRAPVGDINISTCDVCIGRGLSALNAKNNQNEFLYYLLKFVKNDILLFENGSVFGSVNKNDLSNIKVSIPTLSEQKAIASVLSNLDDKIDLLHRQNETLEKMAETLFRKWFVEPYKKYQSEGIITDEFQLETFLKWIAETVGGEWGKEVMDNDFSKAAICLRGTDIADLNSGLAEKAPLRFVKPKKFENIEPQNGDILIEISGGTETQSTGRTTYINDEVRSLFDYELVFSNFCRLIKIKDFRYSYFVYSYLQYLYKQDEFFNLENGSSGIKNLDYKTLLFDLKFPMPSEDLVLNFHDTVEPLFKKINKNKLQIKSLSKLRDTLLPKLMSGEVRIKLD